MVISEINHASFIIATITFSGLAPLIDTTLLEVVIFAMNMTKVINLEILAHFNIVMGVRFGYCNTGLDHVPVIYADDE
jgi:hypothetical protein